MPVEDRQTGWPHKHRVFMFGRVSPSRRGRVSGLRVAATLLSHAGSTRIPKVQSLISEYFSGKDLNRFAGLMSRAPVCCCTAENPPPGMHWKVRDLRGGPRSSWTGSRRTLPKRLGAVTVGYKCH